MSDNNLSLSLRWFSHELANGLSVLRTALDMSEGEMTEAATSQLIGLLRAVQLVIAQGEVETSHFQESLSSIAALRGVELEFNTDRASFGQLQALAGLFLALIPKVITGKITLTGDSTKTSLLASAVPQKAIVEIQKTIESPQPEQPNHVPFCLVKGKINFAVKGAEGEGLELSIS